MSSFFFCKQVEPSLTRLFDHNLSPPDKTELWSNVFFGMWSGLETRSVNLPSGKDLGLAVFATEILRKGVPVAHYPSSANLSKDAYFATNFQDARVAQYAQEMEGRDGPQVLLAHDVPADEHYGHLINHTPCRSCCNLSQVVQLIGRAAIIVSYLKLSGKFSLESSSSVIMDHNISGLMTKWNALSVEKSRTQGLR